MSLTSDIFIRAAGAADFDRIIALAKDCPGAPDWALTTWQRVMDSAVNGRQRNVLVAENENGLVGFGVASIAADDAEIESVAVDRSVRRQGTGRRLCEALLAWARAQGAKRALLEVRASNNAAHALYESLTFREIAIRKNYYREPDEDGIVMERHL